MKGTDYLSLQAFKCGLRITMLKLTLYILKFKMKREKCYRFKLMEGFKLTSYMF